MSDRRSTLSDRDAKSGSAGRANDPQKRENAAKAPWIEALKSAKSDHATPNVAEVLRSSGAALDEKSRDFFESRFAHDFGRVRVHTDQRATESANSLHAEAYTMGHDIVFGTGRYAPHTPDGRALLAHELAHVTQQPRTPLASGGYRLGRPESVNERAAESSAQRVVSGLPPSRPGVAESGVIHRTIQEDLRKAIAGWGTDEEAIYTRLGSATPDEKKAVLADPVLMQDLDDDLNRAEWGKVLGLLGASTESRVHAASKGWGTDEEGIYNALRTTETTALKTEISGTTILLELRDELTDEELGKALAIISDKFFSEASITFAETYHVLMLFPDTVKESCKQFAALGHDVAKDVIARLDRGHNMQASVIADVNTHINNDNDLERVRAAFEARWNIDTQAEAKPGKKAPKWTVSLIRQLHRALQQLPPGHVVRADQDIPGIQKGELSGFRLIEGKMGYWDNPFIEVGVARSEVAGLTRHEVGHAIDDYLGATTEGFKKNAVNGWDWDVSSFVWEGYMPNAWKRKNGATVPLIDQLEINFHLDAYVQGDGSGSLRAGTPNNHPIRTYWSDDVPIIEAAKGLAGKKDKVYENLGSVKKFGGYYFSWSTYYHEFYVYKAIVQEKRLTNYSLFGHPEFFAEMYEAYYEEGPGPERGERLKGVPNWKQFFDNVVHSTV